MLAAGACPERAKRVEGASALAPLRAASVRFPPSRAPSLSPRRAPLLAGASHARAPAPAGPLRHWALARPRAAARVCVGNAAHHSAGVARRRIAPIDDGVKASAARAALTPPPLGAWGEV